MTCLNIWENEMVTITANNACKDLYRLIDETAESHEPVIITGKRDNVVMIAEEDWRSVEETLHLSAIPGLAKELIKRREAKESDFIDEEDMDW